MRVYSNLKAILDERGIKIREFARMTDLPFETLRRLYNDETKQYQRDTIGKICEVLDVEVCEILKLKNDDE